MNLQILSKCIILRSVFLSTSVMCILMSPYYAMAADAIDPEADKILRGMSNYLGKLSSFSFNVDVDSEIIDTQGQKLQFSSAVSALVNRPQNFNIHRRGPHANVEIIFDGKTVTIHSEKRNAYVQVKAPGKIDDAFRTIEIETGIDMPGADLLMADPYPGLMTDVIKSTYMGEAYVNGIECHHLALRATHVDSQIWIQTGKTPLPMKYIITSKWVTSAPQHAIRFRSWNTKPNIDTKKFKFVAASGAKKLDSVPVNELGELTLEGNK